MSHSLHHKYSEHVCGAPPLFLSAEERGSNGSQGTIPLLKASQSQRESESEQASGMQSACFESRQVRCWERARKRRTPTFVSERGGPPGQGSHSEVRRRASGQVVAAAGAARELRPCRRRRQRHSQGVSQARSCPGYLGDDGFCRVPRLENLLLCLPTRRKVKTSLWLLSLSLTSTHLSKLNCLVFDIFLTTYLGPNTFPIKAVCNQCVLPHRW